MRALQLAQEALAKDGIVLRYTDLLPALAPVEKQVLQQEGGTHADESETSMVLYLEPTAVDLARAVKDFHPKRPGPFTRNPDGPGTYSPTGTWGDPTLATRQKGERLVAGLMQAILADLAALRKAELPHGSVMGAAAPRVCSGPMSKAGVEKPARRGRVRQPTVAKAPPVPRSRYGRGRCGFGRGSSPSPGLSRKRERSRAARLETTAHSAGGSRTAAAEHPAPLGRAGRVLPPAPGGRAAAVARDRARRPDQRA